MNLFISKLIIKKLILDSPFFNNNINLYLCNDKFNYFFSSIFLNTKNKNIYCKFVSFLNGLNCIIDSISINLTGCVHINENSISGILFQDCSFFNINYNKVGLIQCNNFNQNLNITYCGFL